MNREEKFHIVTSCIIIATIVGLITYDVVVVGYAGTQDSISRIIFEYMQVHPPIALAAGALLGHLTWSTDLPASHRTELIFLGLSLAAIAALDITRALHPTMPLYPFLLGIPLGHALWGQRVSAAQRIVRACKSHGARHA